MESGVRMGDNYPLILKRVSVPVLFFLTTVCTTKTGDPFLPQALQGSSYLTSVPSIPAAPLLSGKPIYSTISRGTFNADTLPSKEPGPAAGAKVLAVSLDKICLTVKGLGGLKNNQALLNPSRGPIRQHDAWGEGKFGARRYDPFRRERSWHKGVDFAGEVHGPVYAPIGGEIRRVGRGFTTGVVIVGNIKGKTHRVLLLHFNPEITKGYVAQGQYIGRIRRPDRRYRRMTPHVHLEVAEIGVRSRLKIKNPLHLLASIAG